MTTTPDSHAASTVLAKPDIAADLRINKEDIVAIRVAEIEAQIHNKRAQLEHSRASLLVQVSKAREAVTAALVDVARKALATSFEAAIAPLRALLGADDEAPRYNTFSKKSDTGVVRWRVQATHARVQGGYELTATVEQVQPILDAMKLVEDLEAQITACEQDMMEVKRQLAQIPSLERQVKAAVAKAVINDQGGAGGELLRVIQGVNMPGLPAPRA